MRKRIAQLVGFDSYHQYRLTSSSLAQSPDAVLHFLLRKQHSLDAYASDEMNWLEDFARSAGVFKPGEVLRAMYIWSLQRDALKVQLQKADLPSQQPDVCSWWSRHVHSLLVLLRDICLVLAVCLTLPA